VNHSSLSIGLALTLLLPAAAQAEPAPAQAEPAKKPKKPLLPARDKNAISHKPFAITSRGLTLQYERLLTRRVSALGGLGARSAAREDFSSFTTTVLTEGRYWLTGRDFATGYPGMAGPFLGVSVLGSRTSVRNVQSDRSLGALLTLQESVRFGNRFVLWNVQEITLAVSMDMIHEFDERGRLAANTRGTLGFDFTVGWVF